MDMVRRHRGEAPGRSGMRSAVLWLGVCTALFVVPASALAEEAVGPTISVTRVSPPSDLDLLQPELEAAIGAYAVGCYEGVYGELKGNDGGVAASPRVVLELDVMLKDGEVSAAQVRTESIDKEVAVCLQETSESWHLDSFPGALDLRLTLVMGGVTDGEDSDSTSGALTKNAGEVRGSLDKSVIHKVLKQQIGSIRGCYERYVTRHPTAGGRITLEFTIGPDGEVMEASAEQNDFDDDVVANCIVEQAKDWTFPAPLGGGLVLVKYPFLFESNN